MTTNAAPPLLPRTAGRDGRRHQRGPARPDGRARQDSRKRDVLDAAAALFAENGYQGTSMRDIAKAVGMLPGSLYCHFPSKSELLLAVYREGVARIEDQVAAAVAGQSAPWDKLEALAAAHLEMILGPQCLRQGRGPGRARRPSPAACGQAGRPARAL